MVNVAIVEDDQKEHELLMNFFQKMETEKGFAISLRNYSSGEEFLFDFYDDKFDVVLMDIDLGEGKLNGIEVSKKLREKDVDVILIFITNLAQFAIDGYTVQATDYIVKPFSYYDFAMKMENIIEHRLLNKEKKIIVRSDGKQIVLSAQQIYYIEVINHTLIFHTSKGDFAMNGSLGELSKELSSCSFSLCNSCYLVNLRYVESIYGYIATVNGKELTISRPKKKQFLMDLNRYLGL